MTRSKRRRSAITAAVSTLAVIGAAVALLLGTNAIGSGAGGDLTRVSNHGRPVNPGPLQRKEMENVEATSVALLAARDNRSFYRLSRDDGNVCYAINSSTEPDHIGNTVCPLTPTSFPTPSTPVLDLSVFESTSHTPGDFHVVAAQGFAADGVASVELVDGKGHLIARRWNADNVYALDVPPGRVATGVVAYDADGAEVFRVP
jgi:hypothetical protein